MNPSRSRGRKRVWRVVVNKLLTNRHRTDTLILKSPARYHPVDIPKAPGHFFIWRKRSPANCNQREEERWNANCQKKVTERNKRARRACIAISVQKTRAVTFWPLENPFPPSRWSAIFIQLLSFSLCVCVTANELRSHSRWERQREKNPPAERSRDIGEAHRDKREKKETSLWRTGVWMTHDDAASAV